MTHLDDFLLLRYAAGDLASNEQDTTARHLTTCDHCTAVLSQLELVDQELRAAAMAGLLDDASAFDSDDPFRQRPTPRGRRHASLAVEEAIRASQGAREVQERILGATGQPEELEAVLAELSMHRPEDRLGLLYELQEAGRTIAHDPLKAGAFAQLVLNKLENHPRTARRTPAEVSVPWNVLRAQAHVLVALSCMWTKEFTQAGAHLLLANRLFGHAGDNTGVAIVELTEAQRRAFTHDGRTALVLARRARATFEAYGLEDLAARAMVAEGLAHFALNQQEDAVRSYRAALPVFERYELWSNYVGALNSIGTSLVRLGRADEARREYARALRRFSRDTQLYWLGFLRTGLAETLLAAGRCAEAAVAAARAATILRELGLGANALIAALLEIESWARHGNIDRARHRLELFFQSVTREHVLDTSVLQELHDALTGAHPDFERLAMIRHHAEEALHTIAK